MRDVGSRVAYSNSYAGPSLRGSPVTGPPDPQGRSGTKHGFGSMPRTGAGARPAEPGDRGPLPSWDQEQAHGGNTVPRPASGWRRQRPEKEVKRRG